MVFSFHTFSHMFAPFLVLLSFLSGIILIYTVWCKLKLCPASIGLLHDRVPSVGSTTWRNCSISSFFFLHGSGGRCFGPGVMDTAAPGEQLCCQKHLSHLHIYCPLTIYRPRYKRPIEVEKWPDPKLSRKNYTMCWGSVVPSQFCQLFLTFFFLGSLKKK